MNPTSNKSDFEDLTTNLKDLAYSYLEKYSPSKQQLKVYLLKKYLTKIKEHPYERSGMKCAVWDTKIKLCFFKGMDS